MILYLIMGLMFAVGLFSNVDVRNDFLKEFTLFQAILTFILIVMIFPIFIGCSFSIIESNNLREQEEDEDE